jgi:hypothetical protein
MRPKGLFSIEKKDSSTFAGFSEWLRTEHPSPRSGLNFYARTFILTRPHNEAHSASTQAPASLLEIDFAVKAFRNASA